MKTTRRCNRREFLFTLSAMITTGWSLIGARAWSADDLPPGKKAVSESDTMAKALGYKHDAAKADSSKYPQLKTPEGKKQNCANCNFYVSENAGWGKCQLIQGGSVNAKGWCASWIKKA